MVLTKKQLSVLIYRGTIELDAERTYEQGSPVYVGAPLYSFRNLVIEEGPDYQLHVRDTLTAAELTRLNSLLT